MPEEMPEAGVIRVTAVVTVIVATVVTVVIVVMFAIVVVIKKWTKTVLIKRSSIGLFRWFFECLFFLIVCG